MSMLPEITERVIRETIVIGDAEIPIALTVRWDDQGNIEESLLQFGENDDGGPEYDIRAVDLVDLMHPLITTLRTILTSATLGVDDLDDAWGSSS